LDAHLYSRRRSPPAIEAQANERKSVPVFPRDILPVGSTLEVCSGLRDAPKVLAVGDLHVGSFGTWRDTEGRLSWGVDDFDESYPLPYTNDLVRLAASVRILIDSEKLTIRSKEGCSAILEGYQKALKAGGRPFVLAEHERNLDQLGLRRLSPPTVFGRS
jgi:uncharacterized protein (DUF2252 family)